MGLINRDALLKKDTLKIVKVMLTETDYVFVREMTGRERDTFEQSLLKKVEKNGKIDYQENLTDFRAKLCVCTVCDEQGALILNEGDYKMLSKHKKVTMLDKIVEEAQKLNKIREADKEAMLKN